MKRYVYKPTLKKIESKFPYSAEVPKGFRTATHKLCQERLGKCYYRYMPQWKQHWINGRKYLASYRPWVVNEDAQWTYDQGRLYVKDESALGMIMLAMLKKGSARNENKV